MIYLGDDKIGRLYLGSTEIGKAYLGSDLVFQKGGPTPPPPPPYDAEVEYLSCSGDQYIDTGLYGESGLDYEVNIYVQGVSASVYYSVLGDRYSSSARRYTLLLYPRNVNAQHVYYNNGAQQVATPASNTSTITGWHTYAKDGLDVYKDGASVGSFTQESYITPNTILLFATRNDGVLSNPFTGRGGRCKFSKGGVLLRSFIPVRVGQVGYMYEEVSGLLYGNAGTGTFTLGPDVTQ